MKNCLFLHHTLYGIQQQGRVTKFHLHLKLIPLSYEHIKMIFVCDGMHCDSEKVWEWRERQRCFPFSTESFCYLLYPFTIGILHHKKRMQKFGDISASLPGCSYRKQWSCKQILSAVHCSQRSVPILLLTPKSGVLPPKLPCLTCQMQPDVNIRK